MVADDRGQVLLLGGLAIAIVFLTAIPLSNSLVVTESASSSETVVDIDRAADREASVQRGVGALLREVNTSNVTAVNQSLEQFSASYTNVSARQDGVYVNASVNVSRSLRDASGEDFEHPRNNRNNWDLVANSTRTVQFSALVAGAPPTDSNAFTITFDSTDSSDFWRVRVYNQTPSGPMVVETDDSGPSSWQTACVGSQPVEIRIHEGTCTVDGTTSGFATNYTSFAGESYTVDFDNGNSANVVGNYTYVGDGDFTANDLPIGAPVIDLEYIGPDVSYQRTTVVNETP
jgi:hypothetical protein